MLPGTTEAFHYINNSTDVIITYNPETNKMNGHAKTSDGKVFKLENCGAIGHVWSEINITLLREKYKNEEKDYIEMPPQSDDYVKEISSNELDDDNITMAVISIKFYYTPTVFLYINDMEGFVDQLVSAANQGFLNSRVAITIEKHCIELSTVDDVYNSDEMLTKFKEMKASLTEVKGSADASTLIVNDMDACGNSYFNGIEQGYTLSVITRQCAVSEYSFVHELGHNMGLQHDNTLNRIYYYGHGHLIEAGHGRPGSRTIMAYQADGHKRRQNVFSNPSILNAETGTKIGVVGISNSAAVLIRNRKQMSLLGDESEKCLKLKVWGNHSSATELTTYPALALNPINSKTSGESVPDFTNIPSEYSKSYHLSIPRFKDDLEGKNDSFTPTNQVSASTLHKFKQFTFSLLKRQK